jgi:ferredoxin
VGPVGHVLSGCAADAGARETLTNLTMKGTPVNVTVDPDRCQGHARCWEICPEVFALDEEGHSVVSVAEVPAELEAQVTRAASNCPERAITYDQM